MTLAFNVSNFSPLPFLITLSPAVCRFQCLPHSVLTYSLTVGKAGKEAT